MRWLAAAALLTAVILVGPSVHAQSQAGFRMFDQKCGSCHQAVTNAPGAPPASQLRRMSAEVVYAALTTGKHADLPSVTPDEKRQVSAYLGGRKVNMAEVGDAARMSNRCAANPPLGNISTRPLWNGWGVDETNGRYQPAGAAGLTPGQVPQLKLKWAFGLPEADEVYGQPTIAAGRVFVSSDMGTVYSLDASTGCVYWSFQADGGMRNAVSIAAVKGQAGKYALYFGDVRGNVYRIDAATGAQLWKVSVEEHPVAQITAAPMLYEDKLYVSVSSAEERAAGTGAAYECCTFRGSVVALDAASGKRLWKTYIISDPPKIVGKTAKGVQRWAPAGAAIWMTPTSDEQRKALYIGTGDSYTQPAPKTTDAVMAMDLASGKVLWSVQDTEKDAWIVGCGGANRSDNCPDDLGPDYDFGASPILRKLADGRRVLLAGQKSGLVWAHDPDRNGQVLWKADLGGEITFGGAADDRYAYFAVRTGGVAAIDMATGEKKWFTPSTRPENSRAPFGNSAAVTAIPGVIFSGSWEGVLRAYGSSDGKVLWEYNTAQEFKTVNGVPAQGGSMGGPGPTVAGGTIFVGSGYVFGGGTAGNVLLAFSAQ
jgi:polyvinyl alcohol dehydrogenase (cytochrome)